MDVPIASGYGNEFVLPCPETGLCEWSFADHLLAEVQRYDDVGLAKDGHLELVGTCTIQMSKPEVFRWGTVLRTEVRIFFTVGSKDLDGTKTVQIDRVRGAIGIE